MADFVIYGLKYTVFLALLALFIAAMKKIFSKKLTARTHYYIWFVLPASAVMALLPDLVPALKRAFKGALPALSSKTVAAKPIAQAMGSGQIQDLAVDAGQPWHPFIEGFAALLLAIWAAGVLVMLSRIIWGLLQTNRLYQKSECVRHPSFTQQLSQCRNLMGIKTSFPVLVSCQVSSPITLGVFHPCILLPSASACGPDLRYVLLHELTHCRQRDTLLNLIMQLFLAANWFNPLLHYAVGKMRQDRESCCDDFVLSLLNPSERSSYGQAVLNWALRPSPMSAVGMGSRKQELFLRISKISSYRPTSPACRRISAAVAAWTVFCALALVPSADAFSSSDAQVEPTMNVQVEDLSRCFGTEEGSFVLYDEQQDQYTIYNETAAKKRVSPNSTYKIYSGLAALEAGVITAESSSQEWDGTPYAFSQWNQAQNLNSAMKHSVNWYFQRLDQSLSQKELQDFYRRIDYGNQDLTGDISSYWMESSLKISPLEQVMLLKDFYENKWDFKEENVQAIKGSLRLFQKSGAVLSGKTGTGVIDGHKVNGWFIGYIESDAGFYVFALNLQGKDGASGARAMELTQKILEEKGIL